MFQLSHRSLRCLVTLVAASHCTHICLLHRGWRSWEEEWFCEEDHVCMQRIDMLTFRGSILYILHLSRTTEAARHSWHGRKSSWLLFPVLSRSRLENSTARVSSHTHTLFAFYQRNVTSASCSAYICRHLWRSSFLKASWSSYLLLFNYCNFNSLWYILHMLK